MHVGTVLVPVDFSPPSRLAVDHGVALARKFRARLILMHVTESPSLKEREQAVRLMSALLAPEDQDDLDLKVVIKSGNIKDEIAKVLDEERADIAVMGTHGRGLLGRWMIGSVTEGMLRKIRIPVMTISRATKPLGSARILFATDLSESSKPAFDFALEMAKRLGSEVEVVHIVETLTLTYGGSEMVPYVNEGDIGEARERLAGLVVQAHRDKIKADSTVIQGVPAEDILKAAAESGADMIVIAVRPKGVVERAFLGVTAERVIREADVPVLAVPVGG